MGFTSKNGGHRPPLQTQIVGIDHRSNFKYCSPCVHKPRLHRLSLLYVTNPVYYLTACTADRQRILANPRVHEAFTQFGTRATERGVYVGRYVLMPDHIHLFAAFATESLSLSDWMKSLKNSLSKALREQHVPAPH